MPNAETNRQNAILLAFGRGAIRLFRVNTGMGWVGKLIQKTATRVVLEHPRPLHAGLVDGGSDIIGWKTVTITQDMVGKKFARFVAIEVKGERIRYQPGQKEFLQAVRDAGGIAGVAQGVEDAAAILL